MGAQAELLPPEHHHFILGSGRRGDEQAVREAFGRVEYEVDQPERKVDAQGGGGKEWAAGGYERGRETRRRNEAEPNLGDDIGDIELSEDELGSDEEDDGSSLDYSTSGSSPLQDPHPTTCFTPPCHLYPYLPRPSLRRS